jgi:hypothetical protein
MHQVRRKDNNRSGEVQHGRGFGLRPRPASGSPYISEALQCARTKQPCDGRNSTAQRILQRLTAFATSF